MKILNHREINNGIMVAGFDILIEEWGVTFKKCTHFKTNNSEWIGFPSSKYSDTEGNTKYAPYIHMEKERKAMFDAKVLEMLQKGEFESAKKYEQTKMPMKEPLEECPF